MTLVKEKKETINSFLPSAVQMMHSLSGRLEAHEDMTQRKTKIEHHAYVLFRNLDIRSSLTLAMLCLPCKQTSAAFARVADRHG